MIIKVLQKDLTWIYDNVHRVTIHDSYLFNGQEKRPPRIPEDVDLSAIDVLEDGPTGEEVGALKIGFITYLDKDRNERSILFGGVIYLCNDEGKTIEKLVP